MTNLEAILQRISRRSYLETSLPQEDVKVFCQLIEEYNKVSGLHIQLIQNGGEAFRGLRRSYGMFQGVQHYFAMAGKCADMCLNEKIGYYGERLILEAEKRGLGTCWVGASFDKKKCPCRLESDELLECVITVGAVPKERGFKEKIIYKMAHRRTKAIEELCTVQGEAPNWFMEGMCAVQKAPSALNRQPVHLTYQNAVVKIEVPDYAGHQSIDIGIAKLHFEIAAGGQWGLGNGAGFRKG